MLKQQRQPSFTPTNLSFEYSKLSAQSKTQQQLPKHSIAQKNETNTKSVKNPARTKQQLERAIEQQKAKNNQLKKEITQQEMHYTGKFEKTKEEIVALKAEYDSLEKELDQIERQWDNEMGEEQE